MIIIKCDYCKNVINIEDRNIINMSWYKKSNFEDCISLDICDDCYNIKVSEFEQFKKQLDNSSELDEIDIDNLK